MKGYDVIGDTVNTAKRIEGAAAGGEIMISDALVPALGPETSLGSRRDVIAKGKEIPIGVYPIF